MENAKVEKRFWYSVAALIVLFVLLRLPSLFEPHWHSDEGLYASMAEAMEQGSVLYSDIFDHKPPFIFYLYMVGDHATRFVWVKLLSMLSGVLGVVGSSLLLRDKFGHKIALWLGLVATILLSTPLLSTNTANTENFFVPLVIWGLYLALKSGSKYLFVAGSLMGLAIWWKPVALFDFLAVGLFLLLTQLTSFRWSALKSFASANWRLAAGFFWPTLLVIAIQIGQDNLVNFYNAVVLANLNYIGDTSDKSALLTFLSSLSFRALLSAAILAIWVYLYKVRKLRELTLLALLVLTLEVFGAFSSGRGYSHYLQQAVPGFLLLTSVVVTKVRHVQRAWQSWLLAAIVPVSTVLLLVFFLINGNISATEVQEKLRYYPDFVRSITGGMDYAQSPSFRGREERLQELALLLDQHERQSVYIYSLDCWVYHDLQIPPQVFYLNPFHMYVFAEEAIPRTLRELEENAIQYIVVDRTLGVVPELDDVIEYEYQLEQESENFVLYRRNEISPVLAR